MMRIDYQKNIIKLLSWLQNEVKLHNSLSLTDINRGAEDFYCGLLNLVYGYKLINININELNAAAIDLGDEENKIAIQVTSTSTLKKTTTTVEKFVQKSLHKKYDRLLILNIVKKSKHEATAIGPAEYKINTKKDIIDVRDLLDDIAKDPSIDRLKSISDFLNTELLPPAQQKLANEVLTILNIIEYISNEAHEGAGNGFIESPDPEKKIFKRFQEHSVFLIDMYTSGYIEYGAVLEAVDRETDFGQVKLRRAANHLKDYSDSILTECGGDPQLALQKIISSFKELLGDNGYTFDAGAAQFYVIDQLVNCNIFPFKAGAIV